jgi:hypothetical protein
MFDKSEVDFVRAVTPVLAEGVRRALLIGEAADPEGPEAPGLLVLTDRFEIDSATPGVPGWLDALPDGDVDAGRLPSAVLAVAARALSGSGEVAMARVRSRGGTWVVLHGARLVSDGGSR